MTLQSSVDSKMFQTLFPPANRGFLPETNFVLSNGITDIGLNSLPVTSVGQNAGSTAITPRSNETVVYHYCVDRHAKYGISKDNIYAAIFNLVNTEAPNIHHKKFNIANFMCCEKLKEYLKDNPNSEKLKLNFIGIVKNEVMRKSHAPTRTFNLAVGYRCLCRNYWANLSVKPLDKLYFVLKKKDDKYDIKPMVNYNFKDDHKTTQFFYIGFASNFPQRNTMAQNNEWTCPELIEVYLRL